MQNYSQNSNNYFENMLGETANIRCANIPYFQIFIIPDTLPYYNKQGLLQKWEEFTIHNAIKYLTLSEDNIQTSIHTPTKTLLFVIHLPEIREPITDKYDYVNYYENQTDFMVCESQTEYGEFSSAVVYNDYEDFIDKVVHYIHFMWLYERWTSAVINYGKAHIGAKRFHFHNKTIKCDENFPQNPCGERNLLYFRSVIND